MPTLKRPSISKVACIAALLTGSSFGLAFAAGTTAEATIKARQQNLKKMGEAMKTVRDETRKSAPNMTDVKGAAATIAKLGPDLITWFPKGTGPESKVETDAKAEIWSDPQGFEAAFKNFLAEAPKAQTLANANDVAGLKAQVGKLGGSCKGCHDKYRVPQD